LTENIVKAMKALYLSTNTFFNVDKPINLL